MNQIKTSLFLIILFANFVGPIANAAEPSNVRKIGNTHVAEGSSYYMSQIGLSYLYSNLDDEQDTKKISKVPAKETIKNTASDGDTYTAAFTIEIKFGFDTSELSQAYLKDIEVLYATYKQHKDAYIEISGHTDSKGSESHNKALSQSRADAVKKYLVNKGIPKDHIITKAIGEEQPISPNINPDGSDNPEGRSNNRRTDIKIVNY